MKRKKRHRTKKRIAKKAEACAAKGQPSASFLELDDMVTTCRLWGWPPRQSFVLAMQMLACGVTAGQARQIFDESSRRLQ
jgi:hypothetical protein